MLLYTWVGVLLLCLYVALFATFFASLILFLIRKKQGKRDKKASRIFLIVTSVALLVAVAFISVFDCYYLKYVADNEKAELTWEDTDDLTLMSFNIRYLAKDDYFKKGWYYRSSLVKQIIKDVRPDVVGFQEVNTIHEKYLTEHFPGYAFSGAYRNEGPFREGLLIAYRADRFELIGSGRFWLSETPDVPSNIPGSDTFRIAVYVTLKDKTTGKTFTVTDTHLESDGEEIREQEMEVILKQKEIKGFTNMVLLGDLNDEPDSPMYEKASGNGLIDARTIAETAYDGRGCTFQKYGKRLDRERIDYFFLTPTFSVKNYAIYDKTFDGAYASDHFPVVIRAALL